MSPSESLDSSSLEIMKLTYRTTQPVDIIWPNLTMSDGARTKNKFFGGLLLVLLCGFYTIPLIAVALLANLAALYVSSDSFVPNA